MAIAFNDANTEYLFANSLLASPPISVSSWFFSDDDSVAQRVFALYGSGPQMHECRLDGGGARSLSAISQNVTSAAATTSSLWSTNMWHHGLWTLDTAQRTATLDGGTTATNTTSRSPTIANTGIGGPGQLFSGRLAELAVWNADILAGAESEKIKRGLAAGFSPLAIHPWNLVAWFRFQSGAIHDVIGKFALTANSSPQPAPHPRIWYKRSGRLIHRRAARRIISLGGIYKTTGERIVLAG